MIDAPSCGSVIAVDVGGSTIKAELLDDQDVVRARVEVPTPRGDAVVRAIQEVGEHLMSNLPVAPVSAGVVVPGLVDRSRGIALYSSNLDWYDVKLGPSLEAAWQVRTTIGNDVAAAGAAEHRSGAGHDEDHIAIVVIGTGIAAAVISGGRLLTGAHGEISEIGHLPIASDVPCTCGSQGCLEAVASAGALARRYTELSGIPVHGAQGVVELLNQDELARRLWTQATNALADAIQIITSVIPLQKVVLGGGLSGAGQTLVAPVARALARHRSVIPAPEIVLSTLGPRAGVIGAGLLARDAWPTDE